MKKRQLLPASLSGEHRRRKNKKKTGSAIFLHGLTLPSVLLALILALSAAAAAAALPPGTVTAYAAEAEAEEDASEAMWSETFYRASDTSGELTPEEQKSLDETCLEFMKTYQADLSLLAITSEYLEGTTLSDLAASYYENSEFGYGPGKSGFQLIWVKSTDQALIEAYGDAADLIPQDYLQFAAREIPKYEEGHGVYGPLYAGTRFLSNYLRGGGKETAPVETTADAQAAAAGNTGDESVDPESSAESATLAASQVQQEKSYTGDENDDLQLITAGDPLSDKERMLPDGEKPDQSLRVGEDSDMPAWYPKEPQTFPFYHDTDAPRIVDTADIFSDEEESSMEARLAELREQLGKDIVVFTDTSTYGLSRSVYAADFYDFNGYGIGDDREGVCLMICMDPSDRGWWACCTGPETMGLYTETVANQIDDLLYEYMRAGDYGTGVADWIENFRRLYTTGSPYSEDWALLSESSIERFHDDAAPRVVDDAFLLTDEEISRLTAKAAALSEKYGLDVVIHTARNEGILDRDKYGDQFWKIKGYGLGDNYDGLQLTIFKCPSYSGDTRVAAYGKGLKKFTEVNESRLKSRVNDLVLSQDYYGAAERWLDFSDHMLKTGRVPRSSASWGFFTILEMLAGLIFGGSSLARAKARMATPAIREDADAYLVPGSLKIRKVHDTLVDTTVSKQYSPRPKENRSSGGSSGGHSSYSGGYSGSSGSSHSGSGRNF